MMFTKKPIALAAISLLAAAPLAAHAVTVNFRAPSSGTTLTNVTWNQSSACEVSGSDIRRVQFYLINSSGNRTALNNDTSSPWRCNLVSSSYPNGNYTLRAYAYDSAGRQASSSRSVTIQNGTVSDAKPTISFAAPANNATISAVTTCRVNAADDRGIQRVQFYVDGVLLSTDTSASYTCSLDNKKYTNGAHTLKAVVTDSANQTTETQIAFNVTGGIGASTGGGTGGSAPTLAFTTPGAGGVLKGNVQGPPNCTATGTNIARIMFYLNDVWINTDGNASNGWGCWIDTTKYQDGAYTLKAVAYNAAGQTATITHPVTIQNGTTSGGTTNTPPTVQIVAPSAGAKVVPGTPYTADAKDNGGVAKVDVYLQSGTTQKLVGSKTTAPYSGPIDTTGLPSGSATLMAVATDDTGLTSSTQRSVTIDNTVLSQNPGSGSGGSVTPVADAHIIGRARSEFAFSQQGGYTAQVMASHTSASSIPESGIQGPKLPNGETLRLGKVSDPKNSAAKVFSFQVHPSDPDTSGSKRSEFSFSKNIEMDKVYWVALSTYIPDWGTLSSGDAALFGTQLHSGDNSRGLSPSFGLYTSNGGRNFNVKARWSTNSSPSPSNSVNATYADRPIPFGRWVDFVLKFKHNTSGNGFLQVWMDGEQIASHHGNLGFNTPGFLDYAKFGYYNWSSGMNSSRKVLLRSPTIVADPNGSTYSPDQVRALLGSAASTAGSSTSTIGTTGGTSSSSGVCSTALCVASQ